MLSPIRGAVVGVRPEAFHDDLIALIPFLRAFSHSLCRRSDLAEDMAQDALAKALRSQGQFEPGTNLKAWLFTILRNEYYSHNRRAWRETHWDEIKGDCIEGAPEPQRWSLELSDTARALRDLPNTQREALILIAAGGFSYEDAAKICKTQIGTMKSRVARGRAALIKNLDAPSLTMHSTPQASGFEDISTQLEALTSTDPQCVMNA